MARIKTLANPLKVFYAKQELKKFDAQANRSIEEKKVRTIFSVSDVCTTDDSGATIGLIRVVACD